MKMKEHFPDAFQVDGNPSFGVQNCVWTTFGEDEHSTADQDSAIEHAVLNHDRMVEEIAELRKGLEIMIEQFESDHNCEYEYNIIRWNKDLLAKLNQEGEE
ncbi:hypothetical protein MYOV024v1_p0045 [Vibrio phage PS34B.2]|nr:hypothetical protein MYOV024v1_p0045 [Vibrio phage PS34B.2]